MPFLVFDAFAAVFPDTFTGTFPDAFRISDTYSHSAKVFVIPISE
jgi:hypothetical protein